MFCERSPLKHLRKSLKNTYEKVNFLVKLQTLKMNSFTSIFTDLGKSLCNFVHNFCEDFFPKQKPLLAANTLIYLNISTISYIKIYDARSPRASYFLLHKIDTSSLKIRPVLKCA